MHAIIRSYSGKGTNELFDLLEQKKAEVEKEISGVKGFVSYTLARSGDGGFSVTVCQDEAGVEESMKTARDWIAKNAGNFGLNPPSVSEGSVIIQSK
jgi:hypothetical protein